MPLTKWNKKMTSKMVLALISEEMAIISKRWQSFLKMAIITCDNFTIYFFVYMYEDQKDIWRKILSLREWQIKVNLPWLINK